MNKIVVYTCIFGGYDILREPEITPDGVDFICFTDQNLSSRSWQIQKITPPFDSIVLQSRHPKILPHKYLDNYETSIYIDGNITVIGDVMQAIERYLNDTSIAVYDHAYTNPDARSSVREELNALLELDEKGKRKEDPEKMRAQVESYAAEGFPDSSLISAMIIFRKHKNPDVIQTMEQWWHEVETKSKRDQLSFNYAAWKTGLNFKYIREDSRDNEFFKAVSHGKPKSIFTKLKQKLLS